MIKINDNIIIMSDERQENAITHLEKFANHPAFKNSMIRIMPDYHDGIGAVIGFTATYKDLIIPNCIGVDIGCGVASYPLGNIDIDFDEFDKYVRSVIPMGFHHRAKPLESIKNIESFENETIVRRLIDCLSVTVPQQIYEKILEKNDIKNPKLQLGTLGGGNHFIEVDETKDGFKWLTVHTGSRNFGLKIAKIFQGIAEYLCNMMHIDVDKDLAYLPMSMGGEQYLYFMDMAQRFAKLNRELILGEITRFFPLPFDSDLIVESVHNYIDTKQKIIRKGAIELKHNKKVIIPLNMRDGIIVGTGKENEKLVNWNFSAPHGAGRVMGRKQAKRTLDVNDFKDTMKDVWSSSVSADTLDESPKVYKDSEMITDKLKETMNIEFIMKPIYNLKA